MRRRRQPLPPAPHLPEPAHRLCADRPVARRGVAVCGVWSAARHNFVHGAPGPAPGAGAAAATVPAPVHGGAALADAGDLRCAGPVRGAGRAQGHFYMAERGQGLYAGGLCGHQAAADFSGVLPAVRPRAGAVPQAEGGFVREKGAVPCRDGRAARAAVSGTYARYGRHLQRVYLFSILREVQSHA